MLNYNYNITGKTASADLIAKDELSYMVWRKTLEKMRITKPAIMENMDRILTLNMVGKLAR